MPETVDALQFEVDHVIARQHRGKTRMGNLAWCCSYCNGHKGPNLAGVDPLTGRIVPLFNPRSQRWDEHFRWRGAHLMGLTPSGRATIVVLAINDPINITARRFLIGEGLFP